MRVSSSSASPVLALLLVAACVSVSCASSDDVATMLSGAASRAAATVPASTVKPSRGIEDSVEDWRRVRVISREQMQPMPEQDPSRLVRLHPRYTARAEIDPAAAATSPVSRAAAPRSYPSSNTLIDIDFNSLDVTNAVPPDPVGCKGPDSFLALGNGAAALHSTLAADKYKILDQRKMNQFFNERDVLFDPRCFYDTTNDQYVALIADGLGPESYLQLAFSKTASPKTLSTADWNLVQFDMFPSGQTWWGDYPTLGFDHHAFYVSVNVFSNVHTGPSFALGGAGYRFDLALAKAGSFSHADFATTLFSYPSTGHLFGGLLYTMHAAQRVDSNNTVETAWVFHNDAVLDTLSNTRFYMEPITGSNGPPGGVSLSETIWGVLGDTTPWGSTNFITAAQKGTQIRLEMGDRRLSHAVQYEHDLYVVAAGQNTASDARTAVYFVHYDIYNVSATFPPSRVSTHRIDDDVMSFGYPSVMTDGSNHIVVYTAIAPDMHPSIYYSYFDAAGAGWSAPTMLRAGEAAYDISINGEPSVRWGDYPHIAMDPDEPGRVWMTHMYADRFAGDWIMRTSSLTLGSEATSACPASTCRTQGPCWYGECVCDDGGQAQGYECPNNCPGRCSDHGSCDFDTATCTCDFAYAGDDCAALNFLLFAGILVGVMAACGAAVAFIVCGAGAKAAGAGVGAAAS